MREYKFEGMVRCTGVGWIISNEDGSYLPQKTLYALDDMLASLGVTAEDALQETDEVEVIVKIKNR